MNLLIILIAYTCAGALAYLPALTLAGALIWSYKAYKGDKRYNVFAIIAALATLVIAASIAWSYAGTSC